MANLSLRKLYKVYNNKVRAVNDFSMEIEDKEFIVFVGPSGCGKSTILRMIAGLEEITSGELYIDDKLVNDIEPCDRDIAMVFQNYALYPHMTVYENIAFGLKIKKTPKNEIDNRVNEAVKILGIEGYLNRRPKQLSGGQRQRVALGRAIVREPKVFLLDEPLSNLDAKLRGHMRTEITKLHKKLGTTFIYVTHDQVEAMTMGTRIVVMKDGFIQQIDTPNNLYNQPVNKFVASFIGTPQINLFEGCIDNNGTINFANNQKLQLDSNILEKFDSKRVGNELDIIMGIRPEDIEIDNNGAFECKVEILENLGCETLVYGWLVNPDGTQDSDKDKEFSLTAKVFTKHNINGDDSIRFNINQENIHLFDKNTGVSLLSKYNTYSTRVNQENETSQLELEDEKLSRAKTILNKIKSAFSKKKST